MIGVSNRVGIRGGFGIDIGVRSGSGVGMAKIVTLCGKSVKAPFLAIAYTKCFGSGGDGRGIRLRRFRGPIGVLGCIVPRVDRSMSFVAQGTCKRPVRVPARIPRRVFRRGDGGRS